jgi:gliding motility-associated-like protein
MRVGNGDTLCVGENCMLWASGAQMYQWTPSTFLDNPFSATTKAVPNTTITYRVIGKDSIGCFSDTGRITVQVFPKPQIDILGATAINLSVGGRITLDTKNTPDINKWLWTPGTGLSCTTCPNPIATPVETTKYTVTGYNIGGCVSTDEVIITVICNDGSIYIPNTFSPNGDGSNDVFFPRSSVNFTVKTFRVFNRWGQMIYQRENFSSNSSADGWDGTFNGVKLTPDVYVYSMEVTCGSGAVIPIKGNVTLIR